jgi:hypothetical protein
VEGKRIGEGWSEITVSSTAADVPERADLLVQRKRVLNHLALGEGPELERCRWCAADICIMPVEESSKGGCVGGWRFKFYAGYPIARMEDS